MAISQLPSSVLESNAEGLLWFHQLGREYHKLFSEINQVKSSYEARIKTLEDGTKALEERNTVLEQNHDLRRQEMHELKGCEARLTSIEQHFERDGDIPALKLKLDGLLGSYDTMTVDLQELTRKIADAAMPLENAIERLHDMGDEMQVLKSKVDMLQGCVAENRQSHQDIQPQQRQPRGIFTQESVVEHGLAEGLPEDQRTEGLAAVDLSTSKPPQTARERTPSAPAKRVRRTIQQDEVLDPHPLEPVEFVGALGEPPVNQRILERTFSQATTHVEEDLIQHNATTQSPTADPPGLPQTGEPEHQPKQVKSSSKTKKPSKKKTRPRTETSSAAPKRKRAPPIVPTSDRQTRSQAKAVSQSKAVEERDVAPDESGTNAQHETRGQEEARPVKKPRTKRVIIQPGPIE